MKIINAFLVLIFTLPMVSCFSSRPYAKEEKEARLPGDPIFITKSSGEKVLGKKISTPGLFHYSQTQWVKLDREKYTLPDLQNYQDLKKYNVKYNNVWATQLKRGKINLYWFPTYGAASTYGGGERYATSIHFLFQKGDGALLELSPTSVSDLLSDNREAQAKFDNTFKPGRKLFPQHLLDHPRILFAIIDMYNTH
jgi:hypothetical protein